LLDTMETVRPVCVAVTIRSAEPRVGAAGLTAPADLSSLDSLLPEADPLAVEAGRPGGDAS
jgi:hypothetical protein